MNDYSDIFFLIGAMLVFSILSRNAVHMFMHTDNASIQSDVEFEAIALAQDIIDEVKWTGSAAELTSMESDYNNKTVTVSIGSDDEYQIDYDLKMTVYDTTIDQSSATNKMVDLQLFSRYLPDSMKIRMKYLKSYAN